MSHVNTVTDETFESIKKINKNVIISQWYEDNLSKNGPDYEKNSNNLKVNFNHINNFFISTHPDDITKKK